MVSGSVSQSRRALPENPFVGLRAYESHESILFFGRRNQTLELMDRLHETRFVAVVGSSGCGKSSLVRAGLIPSLKAGFLVNDLDVWKIVIMKPGETPLYSLAAALTKDGGKERCATDALLNEIRESGVRAVLDCLRSTAANANVLLLVDQFEEIFRSIRAGAKAGQIDDATDFVSLMLGLVEQTEVPAYVVMSMRTDFLGDCDSFFGLPEALNRSQYLVPRLTRQQRREVIEGPVNLYLKEIEPELVDRLLNDAGERSDQLPVLQHALMQTWREFRASQDEQVGLKHYETCGGIKEALNRHAEQAMFGMSGEQTALTARIFRMLTDTDELGRRIRRPVRLSQLVAVTGAAPEAILDIIERFRTDDRSFLILSDTETPGDQRIDISHEALFRQWTRLEGWVQAEVESKEQYTRLDQDARLHAQGKTGWLLDPALQVAANWRAAEAPAAAWAQRYGGDFERAMAYLDESLKERERARSRRKTDRAMSALLLAAVAVTLFIVPYFWVRSRDAEKAVRLSSALAVEDPLVRALAVAELGKSRPAAQALGSIQRAAATPIPFAVLGDREQRNPAVLLDAAFGADRNKVLTVSATGLVQQWAADGQGVAEKLHVPNISNASAIAISPDRAWIAVGAYSGSACVARIGEHSCSGTVAVPNTNVASLAFSPDGQLIVAGYADYSARIWKRDGSSRVVCQGGHIHTGPINSVQFDGQGNRVLTASTDGTANLWDVATGKQLVTFKDRTEPLPAIWSAAFGPEGKWILLGYEDGSARLWNIANPSQMKRLAGHSKRLSSVAFSPAIKDGLIQVATASDDATARLWTFRQDNLASTPTLVDLGDPAVLSGHARALRAVVFDATGSRIVTASEDGTARIWPAEQREPRTVGRHNAKVQSVAFSSDGTKIVTASDDKSIQVWTLRDSPGPGGHSSCQASTYARSAAFSPDGKNVVAGFETGEVRLWTPGTRCTQSFEDSDGVLGVAFSPDGSKFTTATRDGKARIWAAGFAAGRRAPLMVLAGHTDWVWHAVFNHDGSRIVTASSDNTAQVWPLISGSSKPGAPTNLPHADRVLSATFSPDSSKVATASADRKARVWNVQNAAPALLRDFPHGEEVWDVEFSSDGKSLLTASADKTARIWNVDTGEVRLVLTHGAGVSSAAFHHPDDSVVATGADDGFVRLWRTTVSSLVEYLGNASSACLTPRERMRYFAETESTAQAQFLTCEASHGRTATSSSKAATN